MNVTTKPRGDSDGSIKRQFTDSVGTTLMTYTYETAQDNLSIANKGYVPLVINTGGADITIQPKEEWTNDITFISFTIKASSGIGEFVATAREYDNKPVTAVQLAENAKQQKLYANKNLLREFVLESFKTVADFAGITNCSLAQDTTNFKTGTSALAMTCTTSAYASFQKTVNYNLANATDLELKIYIPDKSIVQQIGLTLMKGGSNYFSAYKNSFRNGWNTFRYSKAEFSTTGTITWDSITTLLINITPKNSGTPTITIEGLKKDVKESPKLIFNFDDGYASAYSVAYQYLKSKGLKGCVAVVGSNIGTGGFMTVAQLQEMYNDGWDVLNHSYTHPDFATWTYTNTVNDIQLNRDWLYSNGFARGDKFMMYPVGYTDIAYQVVKDLGYVVGRDSIGNVNYGAENIFSLSSLGLNSTSTLSTASAWIDKVIATGGTLILYVHDLQTTPTSTNASIAVWQQIVDYAVSSGISVLTFTEWYDQLFK